MNGVLKKCALRVLLSVAILSVCVSGCHSLLPADEPSATSAQVGSSSEQTITTSTSPESSAGDPADTDSVLASTPQMIFTFSQNDENYYPLSRDGETQYYWRFEDSTCVLFAMSDQDETERQLAVFSRNYRHSNYCLYTDSVTQFGICGDWIIASVGHREGSMGSFHGFTARLKKDGSEFGYLEIGDNDHFFIVEDWIFYNYGKVRYDPEKIFGCYRIRPDGTDEQYMGDRISTVLMYADDGFLYGTYSTGIPISMSNEIRNFIRCNPDGSDAVTLFYGEALPIQEESYSMGFKIINVEDEFIEFSVYAYGYRAGDSWRGHLSYSALYRVNKDGSNLTLIDEDTTIRLQ